MRIFFIILSFLVYTSAFAADSFDDFKSESIGGFESSKSEFDSFKEGTMKEFETYKRIIDEEFAAYKKEIEKYWDTVEVSNNTRWVEYLNGYQIRKIVDFDTKKIQIDIIGGTPNDIKPVLKDLLNEDKGNAFRRDPVAFNTENKLRDEVPDVKIDKITDDPVITDLFTDKKKLTDNELNKLSDKLMADSSVSTGTSDKTGQHVATAVINLPSDTYQKAAKKVQPYVAGFSSEFKIDPSLVMSVIYNESRFNPLAKSYVPAYGLMQIVPKSAGVDAIEFLEGKKKVLAPSYLYNSENNVRVGTAYLHIIYYRYFKNVKNPESRLYCAIAAYNTGAGNVSYAFNKNNGGKYSIAKAVPVINSMSPQMVYEHLRFNLRYEEARKYIVNVSTKMKDY